MLPRLELITASRGGGQGDFCACRSLCWAGACLATGALYNYKADGVDFILKYGFNGDILSRHGEFVVCDGHAAAYDLPLLELFAELRVGGQGDFCACTSICRAGASRASSVILNDDRKVGSRIFDRRTVPVTRHHIV